MTGAGATIRRATLDDLTAVVALNHALALEDAVGDPFIDRSWTVEGGEQNVRRVVRASQDRDSWECCWVAAVGDDIVGMLDGGRKDSVPWRPVKATEVRSVFVKEAFRGPGIGRALMLEFLRWSEEQEAESVELGVFFSNERAIAFYRSLGFAPTLMTMERVMRARE